MLSASMAVLVSYFIPVVNIMLLKEWYENASHH
jgi:hypothetical protein